MGSRSPPRVTIWSTSGSTACCAAKSCFTVSRAEEVLNQLRDDSTDERPEFAALAARKTMLEAWAISTLGRADEGDARFDAAHQAAEAAKAEDVLLEIETLQGGRLMSRQRYDEAEVCPPHRPDARARPSFGVRRGRSASQPGHKPRAAGMRYDEAIPYFEKAAALAGPQSRTLYFLARSNLAICYSQLGEHDRALEILSQSVAQYERSGAKIYLQLSLGETGRTYMVKGDLKAALPYLERALSLASETNGTRDAAIWAGNLSECYSELRDWA